MLVFVFFISTSAIASQSDDQTTINEPEDIDPLVDLEVTVTIKEIRALDKIDLIGESDFYVKVFINNVEHKSPIWRNKNYLTPNWSATQDVPDGEENVAIKIQLWDWNFIKDRMCDISRNDVAEPLSQDVTINYDLKTGHWLGDDWVRSSKVFFDPSGYGRLNGCDDNTIYQKDRDCEIWFDITQNDYDNDGIPFWTEVNEFETDPEIDNTGEDADGDGVPIEWEHKWGHYFSYNYRLGKWQHGWTYHPFEWNDHANLDPDDDGLDNIEEYLTSEWGSDPFRKDIFLEMDQMEIGPNGEGSFVPEASKDMIKDAFSRQNIVFHIDDGCMGGGEQIPFDYAVDGEELHEIYLNHFLNNDTTNWRRGVFHYGLIIYDCTIYGGFAFSTTADGEHYVVDSFLVSTIYHDQGSFPYTHPLIAALMRGSFNKERQREIVYGGAIMHETGHTLGIFRWNTPGCDNHDAEKKDWLKWRNYRSCMNYNFVYSLVDYSDGSRGKNDFDDWNRIELTFFQT